MKRLIKKPIFLGILLLVALLSLSWFAISFFKGSELQTLGIKDQAGILKFVTPSKIQVNQPFKMAVELDSLNNRVNAVGLTFQFDPTMLQLLHMDTRSSFCQFYPDKKYDNRIGSINLACGSPHPGFTGANTIMTLEFMPLKVGTTHLLTASSSQILKSDGKGTNILKQYPTADIQIGNTP